VVEAGGVLDAIAVAERLVAFVVAEQHRLRVVVDHRVLVGQQPAGGGRGDRGVGELWGGGGRLDGAPGRRAGHAPAGFQVVVEIGDGVGDRADGLDVDAATAARGICRVSPPTTCRS
jgi:hypothetical protein